MDILDAKESAFSIFATPVITAEDQWSQA